MKFPKLITLQAAEGFRLTEHAYRREEIEAGSTHRIHMYLMYIINQIEQRSNDF